MTSGMTFPVPCLSGEERGLFAPVQCLAQQGSPTALQDAHQPAWHLGARWHRRQCRGWRPGHLLLHGFSMVLSGAPEVTTHGRCDPVPSHGGVVVRRGARELSRLPVGPRPIRLLVRCCGLGDRRAPASLQPFALRVITRKMPSQGA